MSYFPVCDFEGHPWLKKKHLVYVGLMDGTTSSRYRLRFCPAHLAVLQEDLLEYEISAIEAAVDRGDGFMVECVAGDGPVREGRRQAFITCYPTQDQRVDYWAPVHANCSLPAYLKDPYS